MYFLLYLVRICFIANVDCGSRDRSGRPLIRRLVVLFPDPPAACQSVFGQNTEPQIGPDELVCTFSQQCMNVCVNVTIRVSLNTDNFSRFMGISTCV